MDTKAMIRGPLVIAALLVVARVVLEQIGAPSGVNAVFGVAWLYLIVPFYFASRIAGSGEQHPYKKLLASLFIFAVLTRVLVAPTYWLAYAFSWSAPRFALEQGGVVGENVSPLMGYVVIPLRNLAAWTVAATIIGMLLGGITLAVLRKRAPAASTT